MSGKISWPFDLSINGWSRGLGNDVARRIVFSNILFITLPVVYVIFMVIDYKTYLLSVGPLRFDQFIVPIVILICMACLWLNKKKQSGLSRNLFLITWPLLLHLIPIMQLGSPPDYFFAFPAGIIFHSIMIQLMLSYKSQPFQFWGWIGINFVMLLVAPAILTGFDLTHRIPASLIGGYYLLDAILYWLLFNLVVFYTIVELERYIQYVQTSRALIQNQKDELASLNQNLEAVVLQRTEVLKEQNQKLLDYAFYNAHELRGPFCRVKGLIHLMELSDNPEDLQEIQGLLKKSLDELDAKIAEIQVIVQHEDQSVPVPESTVSIEK